MGQMRAPRQRREVSAKIVRTEERKGGSESRDARIRRCDPRVLPVADLSCAHGESDLKGDA